MPDFLTPIAAVVSLIAAALSNMSLNRVATLETKLNEVLKSNEEMRRDMAELKTLLRREKRKRGTDIGHAA
jgi:DNA anti-recombination protein RmuC